MLDKGDFKMAHELDPIVKFLKSFGDDALRVGGDVVHQPKKYLAIVEAFLAKEANVVKQAAQETKVNVVEAVKEVKEAVPAPTPTPVVKVGDGK